MRHDPWFGIRVGEARHPGPHGSRVTARKRHQRDLGGAQLLHDPHRGRRIGEASNPGPKKNALNLGGIDLGAMLQPFIQQIVTNLLQSLIKEFDLGELVSNLGGKAKAKDVGVTPPAGKPRKKKGKQKKQQPTRSTSMVSAASGNRVVTVPTPTDAPTSTDDVAKGKGKGKGKDATNGKGKGKGHGKVNASEDTSNEGWTVVQRKSKAESESTDVWNLRAEDWNAPIVGFDHVAEHLDKCTEIFKAVVLCTSDQTEILHTMLRGCQVAYAVIIVTPSKKEGAVRTPGCVGRKLVFRDAVVTRCASSGQQLPEIARPKGNTATISKTPTAVIHVKLFQQFFDKDVWTKVQNAPIRFFHDWLGKHHAKAIDSWGWQQERPASGNSGKMFGLVRIAAKDVESILAVSGDDGVFLSPAKDVKIPPTDIEWVDWTQGESWHDYLQRARRISGEFGLIFARRLGLRRKKDPNTATSRVWLLEDVPKDFTQDQVCQVLSQSFSNVSLIRQRRGKKGHGPSFLFKAARADEHDVVALPVEYDGSSFTLWCRWAPPRQFVGEAKVVHNVHSWSLKPRVLDKSEHVIKETLGEERISARGHDGDEVSADGPAKRTKVEQRTVPAGVTHESVPGDGACLFHAFKAAYSKISDKCLNSRALRAEVVTHMTRYKETYAKQWSGLDPKGQQCSDFDKYLTLIAVDDAYASDIEVAALGRLYDVKIVVVPQVLTFPPVAFHVKQQKRVIALWFNGNHFDPLMPIGKSLPDTLTQVTDTMPFPMRGGGHSDCSACWTPETPTNTVWTVFSRISGKTPPSSVRFVKQTVAGTLHSSSRTVWTEQCHSQQLNVPTDRVDVGARKASRATLNGDPAVDVEEDLVCIPATKGRVSRSKYQVFGEPNKFEWKCPFCPYVRSAPTAALMYSRRKNHLRVHPEPRVRTPAQVVHAVDVSQADASEIAWKCPLCAFGLLRKGCQCVHAQVTFTAKNAHRAKCHPRTSVKKWRSMLAKARGHKSQQLRRIQNLNSSAAKLRDVNVGLHDAQRFIWPVLRKKHGTPKLGLLRAFRCRVCLACSVTAGELRRRRCMLATHPKHHARDATLDLHKRNSADLDTGIDPIMLESLWKTARKALAGEDFQECHS